MYLYFLMIIEIIIKKGNSINNSTDRGTTSQTASIEFVGSLKANVSFRFNVK